MRAASTGVKTAGAVTIGVLALSVGGLGIATAANGDSFLLGSHNSATKTTTLTDTSGTPLSLVGKKSKAPLKVNSSKVVTHLNANLLQGLTKKALSAGSTAELKSSLSNLDILGDSDNITAVGLPGPATSGTTLVYIPTKVLQSAKLAAGTYQVNASFSAVESVCWVGSANTTINQQYAFSLEGGGSVATSVKLAKAGVITAYCTGLAPSSSGSGLDGYGGVFLGGGLNVIKVQSNPAGVPDVHQTPIVSPSASPAIKH